MACAYCPAAVEVWTNSIFPEDAIAKRFQRKGWPVKLTTRRPACPECVIKFKARNARKEIDMAAPKQKMDILPNPKLQRQIFGLLEDHFDDNRGQYDSGWSDSKVAEETGASEAVVSKIRLEAFGEIRLDPALARLQSDLDAHSQLVDELRKEGEELRTRVERHMMKSK